jgi:uncharacterized protein (TIGR00369 family)
MFQNIFQLPRLVKYAAASKKWLDLLGFDIRNISIENNSISCTISFPEKLTGNEGIIHGGIICFVIDSIAGIFAMISHNDSSQKALTKNLSVSYVQPITPNIVYTITATKSSDSEIKVIITDTEGKEMSIGITEIVFK